MKTYPVHERFATFQGEGVHMGLPAFFIRLFGCPVHCPWCFAKGTKLHTSRGKVDVSEIQVGDLVWSFNEKTQRQEFTRVEGVDSRISEHYYEVSWFTKPCRPEHPEYSSRAPHRAKVTGEHPFWVIGKGWTKVESLSVGDVILEMDKDVFVSQMRSHVGAAQSLERRQNASQRMSLQNPMKKQSVKILRKKFVSKLVLVYSIRTQNHTFFANGVLTHNCDSAGTWHPNYIIPANVLHMTTEQIVAEVQSSPCHKIAVITGGEPAIHNLRPLTDALKQAGIRAHLETSGSFPLQGDFSWVTLSPKKWKLPLRENIPQAHEFKFIIEQPEDIKFYLDMIVEMGCETGWNMPIWLHPEWSRHKHAGVLNAISEAVKHGDGVFRAGWQLHKNYMVDFLDARSQTPVPLGGNPKLGM